MNSAMRISLKPLHLLTHPNVLVRVPSNWLIGLIIFFGIWVISYEAFPPGSLRFASSNPVLNSTGEAVLPETLRILAWNLCVAGGLVVLSSLFIIGKFPAGYLLPWIICGLYGAMLGTNSFAFPDPAGPLPPNLAVLWTRAGWREITAYMLMASALANVYQWQQPSWWSMQVKRVRSWRELRLSGGELMCLVMAVGFLGWAAYVEAWQIIR